MKPTRQYPVHRGRDQMAAPLLRPLHDPRSINAYTLSARLARRAVGLRLGKVYNNPLCLAALYLVDNAYPHRLGETRRRR